MAHDLTLFLFSDPLILSRLDVEIVASINAGLFCDFKILTVRLDCQWFEVVWITSWIGNYNGELTTFDEVAGVTLAPEKNIVFVEHIKRA